MQRLEYQFAYLNFLHDLLGEIEWLVSSAKVKKQIGAFLNMLKLDRKPCLTRYSRKTCQNDIMKLF